MPRNLQNKTILISGASSGIGRATALACAWAGMNVSVAARRTDKLEHLAKQIADLNRKAHFFTCDVSKNEQVKAWVHEAHDAFGRIDAVYANAGYGQDGPAMNMSLSQQHAMFNVNYFGTVHLLREALPYLGTTPNGLKHMLICSSCLSEIGPPENGVYAATKAAQDLLAQSMRAELAGEGYSVTTIHPVGTKTEFFKQAKSDGDAPTPGWLMQSPEHVAKRIVGALRKPCAEVWPMRSARLAAALTVAMPGLTAWMLRRGYEKKHPPGQKTPASSAKGSA